MTAVLDTPMLADQIVKVFRCRVTATYVKPLLTGRFLCADVIALTFNHDKTGRSFHRFRMDGISLLFCCTNSTPKVRSDSAVAVLLVMVVLSTTANAFSIYGNDLLRKFRMLILEVFYNTLAKLSGVHQ